MKYITDGIEYDSHYDWLNDHLAEFWLKAFGQSLSDSGFGGVIGAHGDKAYGYRSDWEAEGIPFPHGVALYFMTYSKRMDRPKHESKEWVIENYPKYKPILPEITVEVP